MCVCVCVWYISARIMLKYVVLANMLACMDINPFDSREAKVYQVGTITSTYGTQHTHTHTHTHTCAHTTNSTHPTQEDPEIKAMSELRQAFDNNDVSTIDKVGREVGTVRRSASHALHPSLHRVLCWLMCGVQLLSSSRAGILRDPLIKEYLEDLLRNIRCVRQSLVHCLHSSTAYTHLCVHLVCVMVQAASAEEVGGPLPHCRHRLPLQGTDTTHDTTDT